MSKAGWCFTLNNYEQDYVDLLYQRYRDAVVSGDVVHAIFAKEVAPETGTPHLQGYILFKSRLLMSTVKQHWIDQRAHLEPRRGTDWEAWRYCEKESTPDGDIYRCGTPPKQPVRDREAARTERNKEKFQEFMNEIQQYPWKRLIDRDIDFQLWASSHLSYYNKIMEETQAQACELERDITVTVLWGPTGTGKTRCAVDECRELAGGAYPYLFTASSQVKWVDHYRGQKCIVLDEFDPSAWQINEVKRWLDRYPLLLQRKGGMVPANFDVVFITSNYNPIMWYANQDELDRAALMRRITKVVELTQPYVYTQPVEETVQEEVIDEGSVEVQI